MPIFELDRLEAEDGELVVSGRWSDVRGLRFVRPTLIVDGRPVLASLEHKPWAPDDPDWTAAFPWDPGADPLASGLMLAVAPSVSVVLGEQPPPEPGAEQRELEQRRLRDEVDFLRARTASQREEVDALRTERDALGSERDALRTERDALGAERDRARAEREEVLAARDEAGAERDRARAERDQARAVAAEHRDRADALEHEAHERSSRRNGPGTGPDVRLDRSESAVTGVSRAQYEEAVADREAAVRSRDRLAASHEQLERRLQAAELAATQTRAAEPPRHRATPRQGRRAEVAFWLVVGVAVVAAILLLVGAVSALT